MEAKMVQAVRHHTGDKSRNEFGVPTVIDRSAFQVELLAARIGAALYVFWGILHLLAARELYSLAFTIPDGVARGRLEQAAWDLAVFAIQAIVIAAVLNWRNSVAGYWVNVITVGVVDLGFVVLLIEPGYVPATLAAFAAPIVYIIAAVFSTIGYWCRDSASMGP
jgi:hypothetical protein